MEKVKLALIASGSGTDANSIMEAHKNGWIPEVESIILISTKPGAGCLEKAQRNGVETIVIDHKLSTNKPSDYFIQHDFSGKVSEFLNNQKINLVFLVGCVHKVLPSQYFSWYNIHPADPKKHGGDNMYGLAVHEHVLDYFSDLIYKGRAKFYDRFFTYPTIHEITDDKYDAGNILLQQAVEIPTDIIRKYISGHKDQLIVAESLQKHVLPYEWMMLPSAVRMAAKKIIERVEK